MFYYLYNPVYHIFAFNDSVPNGLVLASPMPTCALRKAMLGGFTVLVEEQWWSASIDITLELRPKAFRLITFAFSWDSHRTSLPPSLRSSRTNLQSSSFMAKVKSVIFNLVFFKGF